MSGEGALAKSGLRCGRKIVIIERQFDRKKISFLKQLVS
jgi:hypothetical protein